jgi:hypothetical protein
VSELTGSGSDSDSDEISFYRKVDARLGATPFKTPAKREAEYLYETPAVKDPATEPRRRGAAKAYQTPAIPDPAADKKALGTENTARDVDRKAAGDREAGRKRRETARDGARGKGPGGKENREAARDTGVLEYWGCADKVRRNVASRPAPPAWFCCDVASVGACFRCTGYPYRLAPGGWWMVSDHVRWLVRRYCPRRSDKRWRRLSTGSSTRCV